MMDARVVDTSPHPACQNATLSDPNALLTMSLPVAGERDTGATAASSPFWHCQRGPEYGAGEGWPQTSLFLFLSLPIGVGTRYSKQHSLFTC